MNAQRRCFAAFLLGAALAVGLVVFAPPSTQANEPAKVPAQTKPIQPEIPDVVLTDQDGNPRRFYTDLVRGKVVLINAIYTSCSGVCPIQSSIFSRVQGLLGDRLGREVQMISVSLDPATDTPERLKEFGRKFDAGPGWTFLTGSKQDVATVLQAMDLYSADPKDHTPIAAIGHEPGAIWMKVINLTAPTDIVGKMDHVKALGERKAMAP